MSAGGGFDGVLRAGRQCALECGPVLIRAGIRSPRDDWSDGESACAQATVTKTVAKKCVRRFGWDSSPNRDFDYLCNSGAQLIPCGCTKYNSCGADSLSAISRILGVDKDGFR